MKYLLVIMALILTSCSCPMKKTNDEIIEIGHSYINGCEKGAYHIARFLQVELVPSLIRINCMTIFLNHANHIKEKNEKYKK